MRQSGVADLLVRGLAVEYPSGAVLEGHAHSWPQLVYAAEGVMTVQTEQGIWVVPPERAVWIPGGIEHSIAMSGRVSMRTLYFAPSLVRALPRRCGVVRVAPLLRELVLHAVARAPLRRDAPAQRRLARVLVDQLRELPAAPLELPVPRDPRARRAALRLREEPGLRMPVHQLAREAGTSRRTLERLFRRETGLSFGRWRQQARLLHAMRRLAHGEPVGSVALEVGYESPSAFIARFRRALGATPGSYYRGDAADRRDA
jgi:AraC-like DNA-binding protein